MIDISFIKVLTKKFPNLPDTLRKAKMLYSPEEFVRRTLLSSIYTSSGFVFVLFLLLARAMPKKDLVIFLLVSFPIFFIMLFFYFFQFPKAKISKIDKEISKEIIYSGRYLAVELESGVTLYDAMKNLGRSYPATGAYFNEIIAKINIGTSMEDAITESIETCPSDGLIKIFWQISNSLRTGSDIAEPLKTVVETLIKEQQIAVNEYGRKLNPLAMFYMLIAIIMPTLGVTMITIISIFVGLNLNLPILLVIAGLVAFMQFMFVAMVNSIRPPVEL